MAIITLADFALNLDLPLMFLYDSVGCEPPELDLNPGRHFFSRKGRALNSDGPFVHLTDMSDTSPTPSVSFSSRRHHLLYQIQKVFTRPPLHDLTVGETPDVHPCPRKLLP